MGRKAEPPAGMTAAKARRALIHYGFTLDDVDEAIGFADGFLTGTTSALIGQQKIIGLTLGIVYGALKVSE